MNCVCVLVYTVAVCVCSQYDTPAEFGCGQWSGLPEPLVGVRRRGMDSVNRVRQCSDPSRARAVISSSPMWNSACASSSCLTEFSFVKWFMWCVCAISSTLWLMPAGCACWVVFFDNIRDRRHNSTFVRTMQLSFTVWWVMMCFYYVTQHCFEMAQAEIRLCCWPVLIKTVNAAVHASV